MFNGTSDTTMMNSTGFMSPNPNVAKMPDPTKEPAPPTNPITGITALAPGITNAELHVPPSPRTHRLRKLQSAHNLGAAARIVPNTNSNFNYNNGSSSGHSHGNNHGIGSGIGIGSNNNNNNINNGGPQPSLITQQRLKDLQLQERSTSPTTRRHASSASRSPQRHRSNSDAPLPPNLTPAAFNSAVQLRHKRSAISRTSPAADTMSLERLLRDGPPNGDVSGALESARLKVLDQGIKADSDGMSSSRIYVWLILLDAPFLETDAYLQLIHRGASPAYAKIRNDTFRTLTTDPLFRRRVSEASLIRLLNAVAWKLHDAREELRELRRPPSRPHTSGNGTGSRQSLPYNIGLGGSGAGGGIGSGNNSRPSSSRSDVSMKLQQSPAAKQRARALTLTTECSEGDGGSDAGGTNNSSINNNGGGGGGSEPGTYVQGMNVLAAPFLYAARSEAEAFVAFHRLLTRECPGYIRGAMDGVHRGLALVDKTLAIVDAKLSLYLTSKGLSAEIYAFPSVLTLCACTPPLPEVLRLWDFLFAYGPHLNIPCIVAQLIMMRNELLGSSSPNKLLRSFPALQADQIKRTALAIIKMLPDDVYAEIVTHAL